MVSKSPSAPTKDPAFRVVNPREPVSAVHPDAPAPVTPAHAAEQPGTPGWPAPDPTDPVAAAKVKAEAAERIPLKKVVILRDYWPLSGGILKAVADPTPEDAIELPIEEARFLEECGVAQSVELYPFVTAPPKKA